MCYIVSTLPSQGDNSALLTYCSYHPHTGSVFLAGAQGENKVWKKKINSANTSKKNLICKTFRFCSWI